MNKFNKHNNLKTNIKNLKKIETECSRRIKLLRLKKKKKDKQKTKLVSKNKKTKKEVENIKKYDIQIKKLIYIFYLF